MLFHDDNFLFLFLPAVLVGFAIVIHSRLAALTIPFLIGASIWFYSDQGPVAMTALLGSVVFNYLTGSWIAISPVSKRNVLLTFGIATNLALLGWFKYVNFCIDIVGSVGGPIVRPFEIVLPAGISFHTFQQIAYLIDMTREPRHYGPGRYSLFVIFFPQFIAGPIVHHREMLPQIGELGRRQSIGKFIDAVGIGLGIFVIGAAKKLLIADRCAPIVDSVWQQTAEGHAPSMVFAWIGATAYAFQLYFDFSGYSDMAIGLARCFGLRLPENFCAPYRACSVSDFWRRWHITLGRFLREYLYIPLGGKHHYAIRNLMVTMLLGGLWHGANWTFVLWGALHGAAMSIERLASTVIRLPRSVRWAITFLFVVAAWVPFRAPSISLAWLYWQSMLGLNGLELPEKLIALVGKSEAVSWNNLPYRYLWQTAGWEGALAMLVAVPLAFLLPFQQGSSLEKFLSRTLWLQPVLGVALVILFVIALWFKDRNAAFLYFQF